jgi:hypothetical protein
MDEGHWLAVIEKVPSVEHLSSPVLEHREAWRLFELRRRNP